MRIMMFSHGYLPTLSGVTLVVQKIARAMVSYGHEVTVVTASEKLRPYQSEDQGVRLLRVLGVPNAFWPEGPIPLVSPLTIRQLVDEYKPDILHSHDNAVLGNLLLMVPWHKRPVFIATCYSLPRYAVQFVPLGKLESSVEKFFWMLALGNLNNYEHVIFCTRTHERDFRAHGLYPPSTVISNGVDIQRYAPEKEVGEDIERRYNLPDGPRILSVGRLMKDKKLDLLIHAMRYVCDRQVAHLLVVGRGSERPYLKALIQHLNLEPNIHLLGYVPEEDLPALYRACSMFAIPSLVEVQSLPALQAAVTGLPIVAANSAALPELVRHGENGLLVDPCNGDELGDAIHTILSQPQVARRMGKASLKIGRAHDEQLTFQAYDRFYRSLGEKTA